MTDHVTLERQGSTLVLGADGGLRFALAGQGPWESVSLGVLHYDDRQHPRPDRLPVPSEGSRQFGTPGTLSLRARSSLAIEPRDESSAIVHMEFRTIQVRMDLLVELAADGRGFSVSLMIGHHGDWIRVCTEEGRACADGEAKLTAAATSSRLG